MPRGSMPLRVCLVATLLLVSSQSSAGASLRASPQAPAKPAAAAVKASPKPAEKESSAQAAAEQVANTIAKALAANAPAHTGAAATAPAAGPVQHKKLDVGFSDFEKNLTEDISKKLLRTATGTAWNDDLRSKFTKNVTDALRNTLTVILKPVKQSIGKTWMALPKDSQKDEYVETLKSSFESVFQNSIKTVDSHLELTLKRITEMNQKKELSSTQLLEKAEFSVEDSLLTEHCYESTIKKSLKSIKKPENASAVQADKKKFCIQSVIGALAHRLNDTQGLISMSMRFEAGAMSLAQKKKKGEAVH